jgi:hypothetical protein
VGRRVVRLLWLVSSSSVGRLISPVASRLLTIPSSSVASSWLTSVLRLVASLRWVVGLLAVSGLLAGLLLLLLGSRDEGLAGDEGGEGAGVGVEASGHFGRERLVGRWSSRRCARTRSLSFRSAPSGPENSFSLSLEW